MDLKAYIATIPLPMFFQFVYLFKPVFQIFYQNGAFFFSYLRKWAKAEKITEMGNS